MDERQVIPYVIQSVQHFDWQGKYAFNNKGRFPVLQKVCFWVLDKLGARWLDTSISYKRLLIDKQSVRDIILRQRQSLEMMIMRHRPPRAVMGWKELEAVCKESVDLIPHQIMFRVDIAAGTRQQYRMYDIPVTVVPWIDGCFLMYDDEE